MDKNEFKFAMDIKGDLEKIEQRDEARRKEIQELQDEIKEKTESLKSECMDNFRKKAWIDTLMFTVPMMIVVIVMNLIIRQRVGGPMGMEEGFRASARILPVLPLIVGCSFFSAWKSNRAARELAKALEETTKGNYDYRLDSFAAGQMKHTFEHYNRMCENLKVVTADLEAAVRIANEANEAKSHFLSNMSHEIRTPINAVLGLDEMIIRESGEEEIVSYAQDIMSAGRSLLGLVNDILDFSKIESGRLELIQDKYDISSVINDLLNMNLNKVQSKGLSLVLKINPELPHLLFGDELRLKQIILNILSNAVKYTDKGHIILSMDFEKNSEETILLKVSVKDTGKGIKEEDLPKLFAPFERIEEKRNKTIEGTGLGMSITKQLLSLMNSSLKVESVYGEGSEFSFVVEQRVIDFAGIGDFEAAYKKLKASEGKYTESFRAPNARIMVVDDTPMNLTVFKGLLKQTELNIDAVGSGRECLELCEKNEYQLIFVDHMMPDMDGIETLREIRGGNSANANIPVVVLTANAVAGAKEGYLREGFSDYLSKPIESRKLEKMIMKYLPDELIEIVETATASEEIEDVDSFANLRNIEGLSVDAGIGATGSIDLYKNVVEEFGQTGKSRADKIREYFEAGDIRNYTIQVHALKSSARLAGANELSEFAKHLEECGNANNLTEITELTPALLEQYLLLTEKILSAVKSEEELPLISDELLQDAVTTLIEVVEAFDFDTADTIMTELSKYSMPDDFKYKYDELKVLMAEVARDDIINLLRG